MDQPVRNLQEEASQYSPSMNWDRIHVSLHLIEVGWRADSFGKRKDFKAVTSNSQPCLSSG